MKILVTADLHLDLWQRAGRDPFAAILPVLGTLDALIVAGDLANDPLRNWPRALDRIAHLIDPEKVHIIPGNHDYYHWHLDGDDRLHALTEAAGMNFAQKSALEIGGVRFLCCTLWTDYRLTGDPAAAMRLARRTMNDHLLIARDAAGGLAAPEDMLKVHDDHLAWLTAEISRHFAGRTAIVTHHGPSPGAAGPIDALTPAFCSDLDEWILNHQPDLWLFGHTHRPLAAQVGNTPVVNISLGYPDEVHPGNEARPLLRGLIDTDAPDLLIHDREDRQ